MQYYQQAIALGSKTGLSLVSDAPPAKIEKLYRQMWREIFLFERRFSRFLPASELSAFNRSAGIKHSISPEFKHILTAARDIAFKTGGLFNPFILPALQSAGYKNSRVPGHETDAVEDHSHKAVASVDRLVIGDTWAKIPYGTAIDLGGCGKGYLADLIRDKLPGYIKGYWLSFGGDIAAGGKDENDKNWEVAIQKAEDANDNVGMIKVTGPCGIATSGTTMHRGGKGNKQWHHIIDPRSNLPAETDVLLASVCDGSVLKADVLASCAVILGGNQGLQFLKNQGVRAAVIQRKPNDGSTDLIHYGNAIIIGVKHA